MPPNDLNVVISHTEYVKSGYFGMSSYTIYCVESRVFTQCNIQSNINGFDPRKTYIVHRRYSDFDWLQKRLEAVKKYKGCAFPKLPEKTLIWKNSDSIVEERKEELQIYIQILARHTFIKYDPTLKLFLTCENSEEFERAKCAPQDVSAPNPLTPTIKKFRLSDTFNCFYTSGKAKTLQTYVDKIGHELTEKNEKYINFLNKNITLLNTRISYQKMKIIDQAKITKSMEELKNGNIELECILKGLSNSYSKEAEILKLYIENDIQLLNLIKEEKVRQEGIKTAIAEYKSV